MEKPSKNGDNGRDKSGRFVKGHAGGPGNPWAKHIAEFRATLMKSVTQGDIKSIIKAMVAAATEDRDVQAAKLILAYAVGVPKEYEEVSGKPNIIVIQKNDGSQVMLGTEID